MNYRTAFFVLAVIFGGIVAYVIFKPNTNEYNTERYNQSKQREDSLISELNKLKELKNEIKDTINSIDSAYVNITKDSLRARIRYNMLTNSNR